MVPQLSLAHLTILHASPPELAAIAGRCGYSHVGLRLTEVTGGDAWPLLGDPKLRRETKKEMAASGVGLLDVELVRLRPETIVEDYVPMLETAAELGARHVLTQGHDPEWARLVDNFAAFCDLAASYGMTSDVEFLTWTEMRGVAEVRALIEAAGRDNAGLMIDTLHFSRSECRPEELDAVDPGRFHFIQIADAIGPIPRSRDELIRVAREDRLMPGEGDIDLDAILDHLPPAIKVAVEIPNSRLAKAMPDEERARRALETTLRLFDARDETRSPSVGAAAATARR
jgi:sugar phosphate isomerase/epimerase